MVKETNQRSALYLAGNKLKLLPQILPHLIEDGRTTLVDVFGGSGTVSLNAINSGHFKEVVYNELDEHLFGLQNWIRHNDNLFSVVEYLHNQYDKSKEDYLELRRSYNKKPDYDKLYLLMCRSNSNAIRFSNNGTKFNQPWGNRRPFDKERLFNHKHSMENVLLLNQDFRDVIKATIELADPSKTVIYVDSPYLITQANYCLSGKWTTQDDQDLLELFLMATVAGFKVVMSNVFENRGKVHQHLIDWCEYNKDLLDVHHLDISYGNSSFRKSDEVTDEVLIVSK